jgi:CAAX protease family protein
MERTLASRSNLLRLVAFVAGAAASVLVAIPATGVVIGLLGDVRPVTAMALTSAVISAGLMAVSLYLLRRDKSAVAVLGLPTTRRRAGELALGFLASALLFLAVAGTQTLLVGASWRFQGAPGILSAATGLGLVACMVLAEELVFRGLGLRYLRAICGDWPAIVLSALLFGAYHLVGSGNWGMGAVLTFAAPVLGALLFGWAAVRSNGLALPLGLHLGGNWVQASVAGFDASTAPGAVQALWRIPISIDDFRLLTAPDLIPRFPHVAAMALLALATWYYLRARNRLGARRA